MTASQKEIRHGSILSRSVPVIDQPLKNGDVDGFAQYKENLEMRMKHGDDPHKFLASEVDLDEEVHRWGLDILMGLLLWHHAQHARNCSRPAQR